jgi:hypothetical protein
MLVALFAILFLGGGSTGLLDYIAETEDNIKVVVENDHRRSAALGTVKAMKKRTKARSKQIKRSAKQLTRALKSGDTTLADIHAVWDIIFAETAVYDDDMLQLRFELKEYVTREEWQEIFSEN